jgi:hypothetical protein
MGFGGANVTMFCYANYAVYAVGDKMTFACANPARPPPPKEGSRVKSGAIPTFP